MRMKALLLALGLAALVGTGIAAATWQSHAQTTDVAATFTATASRVATRTCTGEAGTTFRITKAVWKGNSASAEARLTGTLVLRTRSVVNVATGDGWLNGSWHSRNTGALSSTGHKTGRIGANAAFVAVIDNTVNVDGLALGRVHNPSGHLRGNFSAALAGETITGSLGVNAPVAPDNSALIFRTGCR